MIEFLVNFILYPFVIQNMGPAASTSPGSVVEMGYIGPPPHLPDLWSQNSQFNKVPCKSTILKEKSQ